MIPPGAVGYVTAVLDTGNIRGGVTKGISVRTNDPDLPLITLSVKAFVRGSVMIEPSERVSFQHPGPYETVLRRVVRQDPLETSGELAVSDLESSAPWLRVRAYRAEQSMPKTAVAPAARAGDWVIEMAAGEDSPYGHREEYVEFKTGLQWQPDVTLPVTFSRPPPVNLSTERLVLPEGSAEGESTETVLLTLRPGLDPATLAVEARPETLRLELEPAGVRHFKLHVHWRAGSQRNGEITFRVGGERYSLPVQAAPAS